MTGYKPVLAAVLLTAGAFGPALAEPSIFPTGVTRYDPRLAYNTYVVFAGPDHITRLIDMDGNVVHHWNYAGFPSEILDPAVTGGKRGHVLVQLSTLEGAGAGIVPNQPPRIPQQEHRRAGLGRQDGLAMGQGGARRHGAPAS